MPKKRHKQDTKEFAELNFAEQAKSITASLNNLKNAMQHHIDHAPNRAAARQKCIDQALRFAARVNALP